MKWPEQSVLWKAIDCYLQVAYGGPPPSAVRARLDTLHALQPDSFYDSTVFEKRGEGAAAKLLLRLGNPAYPHMKLCVERRPDRQGFLFRADTHDAHCCPIAGSREYGPFRKLMDMNREIAQKIEAAWEEAGVPTFKTFLKQDLAKRENSAQ